MLIPVLLFSCLTAFAAPPQPEVMDVFGYFRKADSWTVASDKFVMSNRKYGFQYLDAERTMVFSPENGRMSFGTFYVFETRVYWSDKAIRRVEVSIYNKGDAARPLDKQGFETLVNDLNKYLTAQFGKPAKNDESKPAPKKVVREVIWNKASPLVLLEWAFVEEHTDKTSSFRIPYTPEYARVVMVPKTGKTAVDNANLTGQSILVKAKSLRQLKANIVRNSKGDVMLENIPMVDQGQKGYCAASSAERVLRYYGLDIDQHQVAQLAETSARAGTGIDGFSEAITIIGKNYSLDSKALISADSGKNFLHSQTFEDLKDYNAAAKRAGKPQINWKSYAKGNLIMLPDIWNAMDPEILLQSRLKNTKDFNRFLADVKTHIDQGIPLFWSTLVGMYPEVPDISTNGKYFGHMRLIIGYNQKTGMIIYSDSWGVNHAVKHMPEQQAWAMTKGLIILKPRL